MAKLVLWKILGGDFNQGFFVSMQMFNEQDRLLIADIEGHLPPAVNLLDDYAKWQSCYRGRVLYRNPRVTVQKTAITKTENIAEIKKAKDDLYSSINDWLKPKENFISIWTAILTSLKDEDEEIRVILKTDNAQLRRLPLFVWEQFFEKRYHRSEMGIYLPITSLNSHESQNTREQVKILAVLGSQTNNSSTTQIRTDRDWEILKDLLSSRSNAEIISLVNPNLEQLADTLDEQRPQILFFAGHSHSEDEQNLGRIVLSETESLTIDDLKFELIQAAKTGLKLAIFNSCDGIGIAQQLSELQIPNIIVMREPLPDKVAHEFLQRFLEAFAAGKSLNLAVRRAREKLNRFEKDFPGVMWLPMIWQNPAEPPLTWESLGEKITGKAITQSAENNQQTPINNQDSILWLPTQTVQTVIQPTEPTQLFNKGYALLIGVGESAYKNLSLPVTVKDTQALYKALIDPNLCAYADDGEHIRILNNENATLEGIITGLKWLQEKAEVDPDITVIVYYSGQSWLDKTNGNYYLLPHDVKPAKLAKSALSAEVFTNALRKIQSERLLVVIDSCHAAGMVTFKNVEDKSKKGRVLFTSCQEEQKSYVLPDKSMSVYTYHFLEALQGAGNKQGDRKVKVSNLMTYLGNTVEKTVYKKWQQIQIPHFDFDTKDFAIAQLRGGQGLPDKG